MLERRFITSIPNSAYKGSSMRVATIVIKLDENVEVPVDEFKGMHIDAFDNYLTVTLVDSVVYRRIVPLTLAKFLKSGTFKVMRRYCATVGYGSMNILADDQYNRNINDQIEWAIRYPADAEVELAQMRQLVLIDEGRARREDMVG